MPFAAQPRTTTYLELFKSLTTLKNSRLGMISTVLMRSMSTTGDAKGTEHAGTRGERGLRQVSQLRNQPGDLWTRRIK